MLMYKILHSIKASLTDSKGLLLFLQKLRK